MYVHTYIYIYIYIVYVYVYIYIYIHTHITCVLQNLGRSCLRGDVYRGVYREVYKREYKRVYSGVYRMVYRGTLAREEWASALKQRRTTNKANKLNPKPYLALNITKSIATTDTQGIA